MVIIRAHRFRGPEFGGVFNRGILIRGILNRGIRPAAEFYVFHSNNYFFTENDLKVALLQVCLWWFCYGDGWMMKFTINEWIMKDS